MNFHEQMIIKDEHILRNIKTVIWEILWQEMVKEVHDSHLGVEKCISQEKSLIYWPAIVKDIETTVKSGEVCLKYSRVKPKKRTTNSPALPFGSEIPIHLWIKLATKLCQYSSTNYLLILDYTSNSPVIHKLASATSKAVTDWCRTIFSKYGILQEFISENSPCYASAEFTQFTKKYNFTHTTTSPHYHEPNRLSENYVGIIEDILQKGKKYGYNPNKAHGVQHSN